MRRGVGKQRARVTKAWWCRGLVAYLQYVKRRLWYTQRRLPFPGIKCLLLWAGKAVRTQCRMTPRFNDTPAESVGNARASQQHSSVGTERLSPAQWS